MATSYTPAQLAVIAGAAGFTGDGLNKAVAVALAESGGNPQAVGVNADKWRSRDRGLWQINNHWHPEVTDAQAFNPASAAKAAYTISHAGRDWSQWSTWPVAAGAQLGRARMGIAQAQQAGHVGVKAVAAGNHIPIPGLPDIPIPGIPDVPGLDSLTDVAGSVATSAKVLVKAGAWIADSHNWVRVAWVAGGSVGILIALVMIGKSGAAGETAKAGAKKAAAAPKKAAKAAVEAGTVAATGGGSAAAKAGAGVAAGAALNKKED